MAKIKLTEAQVLMLQKLDDKNKGKVIKITEEQFVRLFEGLDGKLLGHPVAGSGGEEYTPQTEKDNEKTFKAFNEDFQGVTFEILEFVQEVVSFLKSSITDDSFRGVSPFWRKLGITRGELLAMLMDFGILGTVTAHGVLKYKVYKDNIKEKIKKLYNFFKNIHIDDTEPVEASVKTKPVNQFKGKTIIPDKGKNITYPTYRDESVVSSGDDMELVEAPKEFKFPKSIEGLIMKANAFINKADEHDVYAIEPDSTWESEYKFYPIMVKGPRVTITHTEVYPNKDFKDRYDIRNPEKLMELKYAISWIIRSIKKGFRSEGKLEFLTNETTVAGASGDGGSSGPFVGPMNTNPQSVLRRLSIQKESDVPKITMFSDEAGIEAKTMDDEDEIEEATTTASVGGSYVTPKIWAKDKKSHKNSNTTVYPGGKIVENSEAFKKTSYPEGEFVEFDDCVRPGHSDVAINGGCSTGAVDGVVKTKKTSGSITSEDALYYEVAKRTGKTLSEVKTIIGNHKKNKK